MGLKSSKSFSLLEVIITVAIFSSALVFILRGFTTILFSAKLSQDITLACLLTEGKVWEIEQGMAKGAENPASSGSEIIQARQFHWNYTVIPESSEPAGLLRLEFEVSWQESARREEKLDISTYFWVTR